MKAGDIFGIISGLLGLLGRLLSDEDQTNADAGDAGAAIARAGSDVARLVADPFYEDDAKFRAAVDAALNLRLAEVGINPADPPVWLDALIETFVWGAAAAHRAGGK